MDGRWRAASTPEMVLQHRVSLGRTFGCSVVRLATPQRQGAVLRSRVQNGFFRASEKTGANTPRPTALKTSEHIG